MKIFNLKLFAGASLLAAALLSGCDLPPQETVQRGYRGTGMEAVYSPEALQDLVDAAPASSSQSSSVAKGVQATQAPAVAASLFEASASPASSPRNRFLDAPMSTGRLPKFRLNCARLRSRATLCSVFFAKPMPGSTTIRHGHIPASHAALTRSCSSTETSATTSSYDARAVSYTHLTLPTNAKV